MVKGRFLSGASFCLFKCVMWACWPGPRPEALSPTHRARKGPASRGDVVHHAMTRSALDAATGRGMSALWQGRFNL